MKAYALVDLDNEIAYGFKVRNGDKYMFKMRFVACELTFLSFHR